MSDCTVVSNIEGLLLVSILISRDGHRGGGGTPIMNFELIPHHKNFKWFTVGVSP